MRNEAHTYGWGWTDMYGDGLPVPTGEGAARVEFFGRVPKATDKANYIVIDTDYDNYSVFYNCENTWYGSMDYFWILGREPTMDPALLTKLESIIKEKIPSYNFESNAIFGRQGEDVCDYSGRLPVEEWPPAK